MNSLEFINQEIEYLNNKIKYFKEEPYTSFGRNYINYCEEKLEMFQQIKTELEAWEVVKKDDVMSHICYCLASGQSINFHRLTEENREIIKKALEVQDEDRK